MTIRVIVLTISMFLARPAVAQNQFALLIKRIALLQVYLEYLQKGYNIARNGWETVRQITKGEFDLHAAYFHSLEKVNPAIKRLRVVAGVVSSETRLIKAISAIRKYILTTERLDPAEVQYLHLVLDGLLGQVEKDMELFTLVTRDGQLKMGDAERVEWIERVAVQVQKREQFMAQLSETVQGLIAGRQNEAQDIEMLQSVFSPLTTRP